MISASFTFSSGGASERGVISASRSMAGVVKSAPRSRERCWTSAPDTSLPRMKKFAGMVASRRAATLPGLAFMSRLAHRHRWFPSS
jgi:hypothetical protein